MTLGNKYIDLRINITIFFNLPGPFFPRHTYMFLHPKDDDESGRERDRGCSQIEFESILHLVVV